MYRRCIQTDRQTDREIGSCPAAVYCRYRTESLFMRTLGDAGITSEKRKGRKYTKRQKKTKLDAQAFLPFLVPLQHYLAILLPLSDFLA